MPDVFYVYAIDSIHRSYVYVGITNNHERRIGQHQDKKEKTTAPYAPFKLLTIEKYPTRVLARKREKYLKSGAGKEYLKNFRTTAGWRNW